jgi:ribosomal-protein-alanine N-acetyltransferase
VSALLNSMPRYRRMAEQDVDAIMAIENAVYPHPWTRGNFIDSLRAGYHCWLLETGDGIIGYSVIMIAADEAHLLNLSIAASAQRRGHGRELLQFMLKLARDFNADRIFLEVRPSNGAGRGLYAQAAFSEIATRRGYYPAHDGREDAIVLELKLK